MLCTLTALSLPRLLLPPSLPLDSTWTSLNRVSVFQRIPGCFPNVQAIKLMDAGGKSPLRGHLHKPRGKMYLQNRATLCFSDLTCLRAPCFKARHKSVKRFPWVTILSGSSHHEDNICGETRPRSTHWAATETRERFSHTPGKLLWVVVAGERFSQADRLLGWGWGCHQH